MRMLSPYERFEKARKANLIRRKTQTHCINGHELTGDNLRLYIKKDGKKQRGCKLCKKLRDKNRKHR
jgi:hypothetical protein